VYQPVVITEFLSFPEEVGDFVIEGKLHKSHGLVWLNVPFDQERALHDIGNWEPPSDSF
jgi:hypothetical protein